jgi:hypothetical protein
VSSEMASWRGFGKKMSRRIYVFKASLLLLRVINS